MPKILYVEDDPFIAEIYVKKFEATGFEVKNVTSGKAVLREVKENTYDLMLLDLVIPELSGMDVLAELQNAAEYPNRPRTVVFSNLSTPEDREKCLQLGADGFISKTEFSPSEVVSEINRFLRQFKEQSKNAGKSSGAGSEAAATPASTKQRILLIEDEAVFVEMFSRRLRDEGYEVVAKQTGDAGFEEATKGGYDLVITDMLLPGMKGDEVIRRLREIEEHKDVPVIVLSASIEDDEIRELTEAGICNHVFVKTRITPSDLVYAVNDFFAKK